jgi:hypothetical protein
VPGGDLRGLLAHVLAADAQPVQRPRCDAVVLAGQAEQEVPGAPVVVAEAPGLPPGDGDRVAGGAGEGDEPGGPGVDAGGVLASRAECG